MIVPRRDEIAAAYDVPEEFLYAQLGLDGEGLARKSLIQLERQYFAGERGLLERAKSG